MPRSAFPHPFVVALVGFLATLAAGSPAQAQVVLGRITDAATHRSIDGAEVVLLDHDRHVVARGLTNARGQYSLRLRASAALLLTVERIGYASADTISIIVPPQNSAHLELALQPQGVEIPGLVVVSTRLSSALARHGFYERERRGWGEFLDAAEIHKQRGRRLTDLLRQVPGVSVWGDVPHILRAQGTRFGMTAPGTGSLPGCPPGLIVDGMIMPGDAGFDLIPTEWIEGIEVYRSTAGVPTRWTQIGGCGLIIVWTH